MKKNTVDRDIIDVPNQEADSKWDSVVKEADKRVQQCINWESSWRTNFILDVQFSEGDPTNGYQWPVDVFRSREIDKRPCLTMNIVRQHNKQIINEAKKNKSAIKVVPIGNGATRDSANLIGALIRQIEYRSNADSAYSTAAKYMVQGGIGWYRLVTQYCSPDSFDQEILIKRITDPLSVYIDPDAQEEDYSDANFGFVFDLIPIDKFKETYPKFADLVGDSPLGGVTSEDSAMERKQTRVCEYFRKVAKEDKLISFIDPADGLRKTVKKSLLPKEVWDKVEQEPTSKVRSTETITIEWYLIAGRQVIDSTVWPGKYIPLIPMIGEETVINGIMDRKGHTRAMMDGQRMYNYNASAQVEFVALQSKTPYIAAAKAIEENEDLWNTANTANHSVLIYNPIDDEHPDKVLPPPMRQDPPNAAPGFQVGMETAFNQMMMTSGQWQNQMGMGGNERTGAAIAGRQQQGDNATYHYQDSYAASLRYCGKQIIDLIGKIYDTKRMMRLLADDNEELDVTLDPGNQQVYQQQVAEDGRIVSRVLNPTLGEYDIQAEVGPAYGTRRQETVDALTLILTQAPTLVPLVGDVLLRAMDFREAGEAADRLKRMVPPQALGKGPSQNELNLQNQLQSTQQALSKVLEQFAQAKLKLSGKEEMRDIDVYDARTKRVAALAKMLPTDPTVLAKLLKELEDETTDETLKPILSANLAEVQAAETANEQEQSAPQDVVK